QLQVNPAGYVTKNLMRLLRRGKIGGGHNTRQFRQLGIEFGRQVKAVTGALVAYLDHFVLDGRQFLLQRPGCLDGHFGRSGASGPPTLSSSSLSPGTRRASGYCMCQMKRFIPASAGTRCSTLPCSILPDDPGSGAVLEKVLMRLPWASRKLRVTSPAGFSFR